MSDIGNLDFGMGGNLTVWRTWSMNKTAAFAANVGSTSISGTLRNAGMYRADVTIVATTLATLAATTAFNILSSDAAGAFTSPVPLVSGSSGLYTASFDLGTVSRAAGSLIFQYAGGAVDISFSITGITTPGPLAAVYNVALTRLA